MYDVPIDEVTADMRRIAKVLNFGVVYGLSAYGIAQQTEFSPEEGQKFIDVYFNKYPGIRQYIESTRSRAGTWGTSRRPWDAAGIYPRSTPATSTCARPRSEQP